LAEFRWILLGLGAVLILGIWWWGSRRSAQAPGNAELRETKAVNEPPREPPREPQLEEPMHEMPPVVDRDWGTPPLEPLNIRTADFDDIPVVDEPIMIDLDPIVIQDTPPPRDRFVPQVTQPVPAAPPLLSKVARAPRPAAAVPSVLPDNSDRIAFMAPQAPNTSERQKIVTVRVSAGGKPWTGSQLKAALELHGLAYGKYQVFHRRHPDGRSLFCVANLKEPGTFDVAQMAAQEFPGVTLFAVLPGPVEPLLTVDELLTAARDLAAELSGAMQDANGVPLSPQRAAAMRDDVARFQASLPVN
jgi:FtsZ-interacting cell division protein ZipA